jgi:predicted acylesterase/phospholipase RssA
MSDVGPKPFRVLSIDGGGMRGYYTSTLLDSLANRFGRTRSENGRGLDVGKGFDLIVGTSTGGIIACGLAAGLSPSELVQLYGKIGPRLFRHPTPPGAIEFGLWITRHMRSAANNPTPLREALESLFGGLTLEELYRTRGIAICIPAVNIEARRSWVFQTPHTPERRRGNYKVVDVCLATSAAPLYFPVAVVADPNSTGAGHNYAFVDGGLWANNPIVIALVEALELASPDRNIEIISLTTCTPQTQETVLPESANWGVWDWKAGFKALTAALDAQSSRYTGIVKSLTPFLNRQCKVVRLEPRSDSDDIGFELTLDGSSDKALAALSRRARDDAEYYFELARDYQEDRRANDLAAPPVSSNKKTLRRDDYALLADAFDAMPELNRVLRHSPS